MPPAPEKPPPRCDSERPLSAPGPPHSRNPGIPLLGAGEEPFQVEQSECTSKNDRGKLPCFFPGCCERAGHPQRCLLRGKLGQARSRTAQPRASVRGPKAKGQRPKVRALRFQRLLAGPFHLKPIKMKCKPKSTGKRRSGSYPHLLPALLLSTLRPGRGPGASQISHMPISPGEWPHCGLRQTKIAASSVLRLREISLQTPESHMWTTMDVVVANERSWSR